jgi:hypothetical protein
MTDITEICTREFALGVKRMVEREFAALKDLPGDSVEAPFIGDEFDPHDEEAFDFWLQMATRALLARRWWEKEGPPWAQPLPLKRKECVALRNKYRTKHDFRRANLIASYAEDLKARWYRVENAIPFELFCARTLAVR